MSTDSNSQPNQPDHTNGSISFSTINDFFWDFVNDPVEGQIEEQIRAQIEAHQIPMPNQHRKKPRRHIDRDREAAEKQLMADYFSENPRYNGKQFRRRFRMRRHLFHRIVQTLSDWSPHFRQRSDAFGKVGFSPLHKCTAAMRMLAYGTPADALDENLRMGESTIIECLTYFCKGVMKNFGPEYLRRPKTEDINRLLQIGEVRGFPGMLGSLDCMHWQWKNCPIEWQGAYTRGDQGAATIMLEAVASHDLWIWHAFFGIAGSNNDLNVLYQSPLFTEVVQGRAPEVQFMINGNEYKLGYYLADGIYPEWAAFVKTIPLPQSEEHKLFAQHQEGARKDVERAFGVLQARFAIIREPGRMWKKKTLAEIMYTCIILHNMIVEDERDSYEVRYDLDYELGSYSVALEGLEEGPIHGFDRVLDADAAIRDRPTHRRLKADLVEHIWQKYGGNEA